MKKLILSLCIAAFFAAGNAAWANNGAVPRNSPVDVNYKNHGDTMFPAPARSSGRGFALPSVAVGPQRNMPVDNNFHNLGDRQYSQLPRTGGDYSMLRGERLLANNAPVRNDYREHGDRQY